MSAEPPVSSSSQADQESADLLQQARQGEPTAIAALLNRQIKAHGLLAQVHRQDQGLHIDLQSPQVPDQVELVAYLRRGMASLQPAGIQWVRISGRATGSISVAWTHTFDLATIVASAQPFADRPNWQTTGGSSSPPSPKPVAGSGTSGSPDWDATTPTPKADFAPASTAETPLQSRARQGDRESLESWLNQALANKQIQVTAHPSGTCLRIMLEAVISPDQAGATASIQQALLSLQPQGIQTVQLYGQQTGQDIPDWSAEFALTPPPWDTQTQADAPASPQSDFRPASSPVTDPLSQHLLKSGTISSPSTAPRSVAKSTKTTAARKTAPEPAPKNLPNTHLHYAGKDLRQLSLANQDLMGADFRGANLSGVSLRRSRLAGADFSQANLQGADLSDTSIGGATFTAAQASDANFSQTRTTWQSDWIVLASRYIPIWAWLVSVVPFLISLRVSRPGTFTIDYFLACIALAIAAPASIISFWDNPPLWGKRLLWGTLIGSSALGLLSILRFPGFTLLKLLTIALSFNTTLPAARRRQWILLGSWLGFLMGLNAASLWYWIATSPTSALSNPTLASMIWFHGQLAVLGTVLGRMTGVIVPLRNTSFRQADLERANFSQAILRNADFTGANLDQTDFDQADLLEAKLPDQFGQQS